MRNTGIRVHGPDTRIQTEETGTGSRGEVRHRVLVKQQRRHVGQGAQVDVVPAEQEAEV